MNLSYFNTDARTNLFYLILRFQSKITAAFILSLLLFVESSYSQNPVDLFDNQDPLDLKLSFDFKEVKKSKEKSSSFPTMLSYQDGEILDSLEVEVRARGNFRRQKCHFPPLKLRIKKKNRLGGIFEDHKNLKLVLPCSFSEIHDQLVLKEFLAYKLYEVINPYFFQTRLVNLELTDLSGRTTKTYQVKGILIEDDKQVADRFDAKLVKDLQLSPFRLYDSVGIKHDFFQMMIANTDWSTVAQHNIVMMLVNQYQYVPLPYDFDMAGLVNAPYATVNEQLPIHSVRQRLYRGICWNPALFEHTRNEYLVLETDIWRVFEENTGFLDPREISSLKKYLQDFFEMLQNRKKFESEIVNKCRS